MTADRIDYYANLLRGIPVAELGRKIKEILRDATNEEIDACLRRLHEVEKQRDELLAAAEAIEIDAEECLDFDECTAMLVPIDTYHKLMEAIASGKGGAA